MVLFQGPYSLISFDSICFLQLKDFDIAIYVNENIPYLNVHNLNGIVKFVVEALKLFKWFSDVLMKNNVEKCRLLVSTNNIVNIKVENFGMKNSYCEKLLGVKFDFLNFKGLRLDLYGFYLVILPPDIR